MSTYKCSDCEGTLRFSLEDRNQFAELSKPLIQFLREKAHPHCLIVVDTVSAEIVEGLVSYSLGGEAYIDESV